MNQTVATIGMQVRVKAEGKHSAVVGSEWTIGAISHEHLALTTKHGGWCHVPPECVEVI